MDGEPFWNVTVGDLCFSKDNTLLSYRNNIVPRENIAWFRVCPDYVLMCLKQGGIFTLDKLPQEAATEKICNFLRDSPSTTQDDWSYVVPDNDDMLLSNDTKLVMIQHTIIPRDQIMYIYSDENAVLVNYNQADTILSIRKPNLVFAQAIICKFLQGIHLEFELF